MAQEKSPHSTAGSYEDQKNNGNRQSDESIGGAEKGGAGLSRAQRRLPPDANDSPAEGSHEDLHIGEDRSK